MFHCKKCGHNINLNNKCIGYCPICNKTVNYGDVIPDRCIDPVVQYCKNCAYGWTEYPSRVETREDLNECCFDSGCIYGLEDTEPTGEELAEFNKWLNKMYEV